MQQVPGALSLMELHVDALYKHSHDHSVPRMLRVNDPGAAQAPRLFLGRTAEGNLWRLRADVSATLAVALEGLCAAEPVLARPPERPVNEAALIALLTADAPIVQVWTGPAYWLPPEPAAGSADAPQTIEVTPANASVLAQFIDWRGEVALWQPMCVHLQAGLATSLCASVRVTAAAHAAGVETLPHARRQGHGRAAVAAWARTVAALGATALYSTNWSNLASQAVARSLDMPMFGVDFHVT